MSLAVGEILDGKYRIVRILGVGGMGEVYEGENTRIHRKVAIKVLHANVAQKADIVQRFEREAQAAGRIGSEHIVEVLDLGNLASGERYMVMEYLDGESLTQRIKVRGRLPSADLANLLRQLLEGLGAAHVAGIVHRDLKPDNIYVVKRSGQEFVKILDFGVSKFTLMGEELSMTKTGAVMGTPYYMSPEQARGQPIDQRSDLYSVGVVAYQALTGRVPFNAETFNELIFKIALEAPEPIEHVAPGVDQGIAAIVRKSMERDPAHRFQNAAEFAHAVDAYRGVAQPQHHQQQHQQQQQQQQGQQGQGYPQAGGYGQPSLAHSQPGHHPQLSHSGQHGQGGPAQSGGPLGQSGSNPGFNPAQMRQSQSNLNQSGTSAPRPYPSAPNGPLHPMGQSQVGLAVTAGHPKKGAPVLLIALSVMAALGVGGGFAFYKMSASEAKPASTSEPQSTAAATSETTATATATAPQTATAATTETTPTASAPTASESAAPEPTGKLVRMPGKLPTAKPEVTAKPTTVPTGVGGRPISDRL